MTTTAQRAMAGWLGHLARGGVLSDADASGAVASFLVGEERVDELARWFAAQAPERQQQERRAAVEVCIWMAHADRDVSPDERLLLRELVSRSGLDEDTQDELVTAVHEPPPIEGVEKRLTHPVLRELMLALAWELAMADGRVDGAERALHADLAARLDVDDARAQEIRDAVASRLE